ncbi:MAG: acyltransferase [Syntrophobacter sp.]
MMRIEIPQLDTLRVVAMLAIFLHHLWKTVIVTADGAAQKILDPVFSSASDGVILFNIISGFLLALPHLGPERRPFMGYAAFLRKRVLRVFPPYYLALLLFTAANILRFDYPLPAALEMLVQHLLFVNSLDYGNMFSNFSHFWYMGQLAQFYLLFPVILLLFNRMGPAKAALTITTLCWGTWMFLAWYIPSPVSSFPSLAEKLMHFNLPGRLPEFAIGMWLASLWKSAGTSRRDLFSGPFGVFACVMAVYLFVGVALIPMMSLAFLHLFHVALAFVFFLLLLTWGLAFRFGQFGFLKRLSEHSYSVYIVHVPVFSYVGVMPSTVTHTLGNFVFLTCTLLPLSYVAAVALDFLSGRIMRRITK